MKRRRERWFWWVRLAGLGAKVVEVDVLGSVMVPGYEHPWPAQEVEWGPYVGTEPLDSNDFATALHPPIWVVGQLREGERAWYYGPRDEWQAWTSDGHGGHQRVRIYRRPVMVCI